MMKAPLILPLTFQADWEGCIKADSECTILVSEWINTRIEFIRESWRQDVVYQEKYLSIDSTVLIEKMIKILTHRIFNFQSKKNLSQVVEGVRLNLEKQIRNKGPIRFFLLYNGGYRASPFSDNLSLFFKPDQTELMLMYQIALLKQKIASIYNYGIEFYIVLNNGVAKWVNDIPIYDTEHYANQFRKLVKFLGAESNVKILVQSELDDFDANFSFETVHFDSLLTEDEHVKIERFLGRKCSREEAMHRSILYNLAEARWEKHLTPIIQSSKALMLRQIAHPDMLSFRPFPGGAIRSQNGSFGFQYQNNKLKPKLITSKNVKEFGVKCVSIQFPWDNYMTL